MDHLHFRSGPPGSILASTFGDTWTGSIQASGNFTVTRFAQFHERTN